MQLFYYIKFSSWTFCDDGAGGNSNETCGYRSIYRHTNVNIENNTFRGQYNAFDPGLQSTSQGIRAELEAKPVIHELDGRPIKGSKSTLLGIPSTRDNYSYVYGEIPLTQSEINAHNHYWANASEKAIPPYVPSTLEKVVSKAKTVYKKIEKWEKEGHLKIEAERRRLMEEEYRRRCLHQVLVNKTTIKDLKRSGFIIDKSNEIIKRRPKLPNYY